MNDRHTDGGSSHRSRLRLVLAATLVTTVTLVSTIALTGGSAQAVAQASPPQNTSSPAISGSAVVGQTLSATSGSWAGDTPITFSYQWLRCNSSGASCGSIGGATDSTHQLTSSDSGSRLRVRVTATNSAGQASADSSATAVIVTASAPVNTREPTVSGSATVGQRLSGSNGSWSGTSPIGFAYQWVRCGSNGGAPDGSNCTFLAGATSSTYTLQPSDAGGRMRIRVTATNSAGSKTAASNPTGTVGGGGSSPANTAEPTISGSAVLGQTLSASTGTWTGSTPIAYAYQWVRCGSSGGRSDGSNCTFLAGATNATYVLQSPDVGGRMRVRVTASNSSGSRTVASNPTGTVKSGPVLPDGAIKLPGGQISIPVTSVNAPERLIVQAAQFSPNPLGPHGGALSLRVLVTDTRGYVVRDALVFARSVPIVTSTPGEQRTGQDGTVTLTFAPRADFPFRNGANVQFFVRVRKDGDNILAGVSNRRLIQVATTSG